MSEESSARDEAILDLERLLSNGVNSEAFALWLFEQTMQQLKAVDPELAEMLRACAIPRSFDADTIAVLRNAPDDRSRNEELLGRLVRYEFVLDVGQGVFAYHDVTRDAVLRGWYRDETARPRFQLFNERLVRFYLSRYDHGQELSLHLGRMSQVVKRASLARYSQLVSAIDEAMLTPLLAALYHKTLLSPEEAYKFLWSEFKTYEGRGAFNFCNSLVNGLRENLKNVLSYGFADEAVIKNHLRWMDFLEMRIMRSRGEYSEAEAGLRQVLKEADEPKLRSWILSEIGLALHHQFRLEEAREVYEEELQLALATRVDPMNISSSYTRVGMIEHDLGKLDAARDAFTKAIESAREENNPVREAYGHVFLARLQVYQGDPQEALSYALVALDMCARSLGKNFYFYLYLDLADVLMAITASWSPQLLDTLHAQRRALIANTDSQMEKAVWLDYIRHLRSGGQLRRARSLLEQLVVESQSIERMMLLVLREQVELAKDQGLMEQALAASEELVRRAKQNRNDIWALLAGLGQRGVVAGLVGLRADGAKADLREAIDRYDWLGNPVEAAFYRCVLAEDFCQEGELGAAQRLLEENVRSLIDRGPGLLKVKHDQTQAQVHWRQAQWEGAEGYFESALDASRQMNQLRDVAGNAR